MELEIIYLVDDTVVKDLSTLQTNIDVKLIKNSIRRAQEIYIQPLLGTALYKKLLDLVKNNTIDSAGNEKYATLYYDYVILPLVEYTVAVSYRDLLMRYTNTGIGTLANQQQNPLSLKDLQQLIDQQFNFATNYADNLTRYLLQNNGLYPELNQNTTVDSIPFQSTDNSPIFYKRRLRNRSNWDVDCWDCNY